MGIPPREALNPIPGLHRMYSSAVPALSSARGAEIGSVLKLFVLVVPKIPK